LFVVLLVMAPSYLEVGASGRPGAVQNLKAPAVSRYAATTPHLLKFFYAYNAVREPHEKVRPFNFMIGLQPNRIKFALDFPELVTFGNSRKSNLLDDWKFSAIAPYTRDPWEAVKTCFDRNSGLKIPKEYLRTYEEVLTSYHLRPEGKFENVT
ncbi:hypothetical protein, partial [Phreatobacter sp.]|uniref:hypothetical protein n=1 Tax=Phreatobacter sp. TaxID=1966341 RepID=UPI003F7104CC